MTQISPYLLFNGNCGEAMRFYQKTLGGKLDIMTFADAPAGGQMQGDPKKVMHAALTLDGGSILASDVPDSEKPEKMGGFSVTLSYESAEEGRRIFDALSKGGKVLMPYDRTFWAEGFGMLVDRFGTPWFINAGAASGNGNN